MPIDNITPDFVPADQDEYLTLDEATQFLGTSKPTLYRWLATDEIKGFKAGKKWRFRKADLIAYLQRLPVMPAVPKDELHGEIEWALGELREQGGVPDTDTAAGEAEAASDLDRLRNLIIVIAIESKASDIHLEPVKQGDEKYLRLRLRIDGALYETRRIPFRIQDALMMAFKQQARCEPTERRPQTGRILASHNGQDYELRLSFLPTQNGEELVVRIIHRGVRLSGLANLGLGPTDIETVHDLMNQPNGVLLVVGPQGSGKTTLMYSLLEQAVGEHRKAITIEDPIEFSLPYATQVALSGWAGSSAALALRAAMRHDPDILLVGDLNEQAVASLACDAALTGHLVIAALSVPGTASAIQRLFDLSVAPFIAARSLLGIVSVRLMRKVCTNCKTTYEMSGEELRRYGFDIEDGEAQLTLARGQGCDQCRKTGYRGRTGLFEILVMNREISAAVEQAESGDVIMAIAHANGFQTLQQQGLVKVLAGETTPEEVLRVSYTAAT